VWLRSTRNNQLQPQLYMHPGCTAAEALID
jgi:hypothetical protein